jgi:hypothetical protein
VIEQEDFATGAYHTGWLTEFLVDWQLHD